MENLYKLILINLERDKDRLEYVTNQLGNIGLEFERLEAVNGKEYIENGGEEYDENLAIKVGGRTLKLGEIGCALSHKRCYQKFLNDPKYKDTKYLLILEDDITLDKNFKNILEEEIRKNEDEYKWNYLQFNYPKMDNLFYIFINFFKKFYIQYLTLKSKVYLKDKIKRLSYLFFAPFFSTFLDIRNYILYFNKGSHRFFKILPLTGGYLIDKKVAKKLLELTTYISEASDIVLANRLINNRGFNFYFYTPLVIKQENILFKSSIDNIDNR